ncbi:uncharacterized protein hhla2b.1 isoform X2 [Triplophysa dalaica]|uniref:uncharacterized protein hhla2b.1 isoform X2 n=1 Tax=Triplophysa dalaica TaxID=1582913 RepID=UPI0024DF737F|nr:uncharacterized protein hhla2b.1 isoform X2 [Triplophysa dalaica]
MARQHSWIFLIRMWMFVYANGKTPDVLVTCMFSEDCILPCLFEPVGDEIIYWFRQNVLLHTFKQESGILDQPDKRYTGRTSLSNDTIPFGNASLHIQKSGPQDRGRYRCLVTSGRETSEHSITVRVKAPIESVNMETTWLSGYEEVKCSARDVYPAPRVTLFTEPPVLPDGLQTDTRKTADKQGLYRVDSKIRKLENQADLTYICLVQSFYGPQIWRTSLQEKEMYSVEGKDFIIPCVAPWILDNFTLTWSFAKEHKSSVIYTYDSITHLGFSVWEERIRLVPPSGQRGNGSLQLHNPMRTEHTGIYTCVLSSFQTKHVVHTRVNIIPMTAKRLPKSSPQRITAAIITGLTVTAVVIGLAILKWKVSRTRSNKTHEEATEMHPTKDANSGDPSETICLSEETEKESNMT